MKGISVVIGLFGLMLSPWIHIQAEEPMIITKIFQPTQALFANPERGWITHRFSNDFWGLADIRESVEKVSLVLIKIDLSGYVNTANIGQNKLNEIRTVLNTCRQQGLKTILRSAYSWEHVLAPEPKNIETIKNHIMDMKPIYKEYESIIVAVEMGMFGPWGEMHSSQYSTINTQFYYPVQTAALKQVHSAYMSALPASRSVLVRRPYYIRQIFNDSKPLVPEEGYSGTAKARTGYHNDAYLASADDEGTFESGWTRAQELDYVNKMTKFSIFGGESFGTPNDTYNNAKNALLESKQQHMTYLHRDYSKPIYNAWGVVKEDFTRKLGYRFEFKTVFYSKEVAPGGILNFSLKLQNTGFSAMHLRRPVNLILDNGKIGSNRVRYQATLSVDPRTWTPEANIITINRKLRVPFTINEGTWKLLLALPDNDIQLQNDARFAVRFGNDNTWNTDGTNQLVDNLVITATATGSRNQENVFKEITDTTPLSSIDRLVAMKTTASVILSATYDQLYPYIQVYIDADNNSMTGLAVQGIGADFLVENNYCYRHIGNTVSAWSWQLMADTATPSINNLQYTWIIPISTLNLPITAASQVIFAGAKDGNGNYSRKIYFSI